MEDNKKVIEHEVRIKRVEEDIRGLNNSVQEIREKQASLESVQMVTLEKLGRIEELARETYNKLDQQEEQEVTTFEKYKFWLITGVLGALVSYGIFK